MGQRVAYMLGGYDKAVVPVAVGRNEICGPVAPLVLDHLQVNRLSVHRAPAVHFRKIAIVYKRGVGQTHIIFIRRGACGLRVLLDQVRKILITCALQRDLAPLHGLETLQHFLRFLLGDGNLLVIGLSLEEDPKKIVQIVLGKLPRGDPSGGDFVGVRKKDLRVGLHRQLAV